MVAQSRAQAVIQQVQTRLWLAAWGRVAFWCLVVIAALYAVSLLAGRLTGYFPTAFEPWHVALLPAAAALVGLLLTRRPVEQQAARAIDTQQRTKDLFLTATLLDSAAGEYKPLVLRDVEQAAGHIHAGQVVTFQWERPCTIAAGLLGALLLGAYFVPVLDPFGKVAEAKQEQAELKVLERSKQETERRKAELAKKDVEQKNSEEVEMALEKLVVAFQGMKKGEKQQNQQKLSQHQLELSKMYQKLNSGDLKELLGEPKIQQQLGAMHNEELFRKLQRELQQGSSESMEQELESVKSDLERLLKEEDPVKKTEMQRQLQKKMKELSDFASDKAGSKQLHAALERAMQQLEAAKKGEALSKEALEALQESLQLAQEEAKELAQSARDLKSLEEALEMISMAKKMNAEDQLDGEMMGGEMTLEEYEEMYAQLMGMGGMGDGEGLGGEGIGEGGEAPEDDSVETGFKDEKSKSAIQKGKILLSMKTKGLSDTGDIKDEEYQNAVSEIRQSLDNVIEQEQIPPGYIDNIKKYFDTIGEPANARTEN